ncbi:MAG: type II toxin-antitoxin system RelE/ParE family toxin [Deltaproteobacteria bacterium]|nr:type II toxin-antitoxin system RelE/ParE family toxin [Deltaproteobacteria bacterium]
MKVRFTPSARRSFLAALGYIHHDNPSAAQEFRDKTEKILRRLERFPKSGRSIPEFPDLPHREVIVPPYRFFYRLEKKTIWIVAVWHGAQQIRKP